MFLDADDWVEPHMLEILYDLAEADEANVACCLLQEETTQETESCQAEEKKNIDFLVEANKLFERVWKMYPNKKGKGQVSDTQKKRPLAIGEDKLVKAIERYSLELQKDADWRKAQYGSTFFNSGYVDYLDENYVPGKETKAKKNAFNNFDQRQHDYDALEKMLLNTEPGGN